MSSEIQRLGYRPKAPYELDLEVFSMADLRRRAKEQLRLTHRYEFHTFVCVTRGQSNQMVDFKPISCEPGSLVFVRAGQVHNYGQGEDWDGWNILFRPEFVLPASMTAHDFKTVLDIERLPEHLILNRQELGTITDLLQQIQEDAKIDGLQEDVNALLRHQLHTLLTRLRILQGAREAPHPQRLASTALQRFKRFQQLVEERFPQWHQVTAYADQLGHTERTLTRAVMASTGMTAKAFIAARIVLEAKRLLAHTDIAVMTIAEKLGFDETTNFCKFFKREAQCAPAEFRRRQRTSVPVAQQDGFSPAVSALDRLHR